MDRRNLAKRLIRLGADIHTTDWQTTSLHAATTAGHVGMLKLLMKSDGVPDNHGAKAINLLSLALAEGQEDAATFLFGQINDPDEILERKGGFTALHAACLRHWPQLARVILESGANIHARTSEGNRALHLALQQGVFEDPGYAIRWSTLQLVKLLIEFGARLDEKACRLGLRHSHAQVREIFLNPQAYMQSKTHAHSTHRRATRKVGLDLQDEESFPTLDPLQLSRDQRLWSSSWDLGRVYEIKQAMRSVDRTMAESPATSAKVEEFPKVIGLDSPHVSEGNAQVLWQGFAKSRTTEFAAPIPRDEEQGRSQAELAPPRKNKKKWLPFAVA